MPTKKEEQLKDNEQVVDKKDNTVKNKAVYIKISKVLKKPVITEKTAIHEKNNNEYVFKVNMKTTKVEVKKAIKELYGVDVESVNTIIRKGKPIRFGKTVGTRSDEKMAIVKIKAGQSINVFK